MAYIPKPLNPEHWNQPHQPDVESPLTIVVQALRENKRPIGFHPWPEQETDPKKRKKRKRRP